METMYDEIITAEDVARLLKVSKEWVYSHCHRKKPTIPHLKMGGHLRFNTKAVLEFANGCDRSKQWPDKDIKTAT